MRSFTIFLFLLIFVLQAVVPAAAETYAVPKNSLPSDSKALDIVSFNAGNAGNGILSILLRRHCLNYKLCRENSVVHLRDWLKLVQPDVLLLQETRGIEQVLGKKFFGPLLDPELYGAYCGYHVCVAWKKSKVASDPKKDCREDSDRFGDISVCDLHAGSTTFQAVSVYYPVVHFISPPVALRQARREKLMRALFYGAGNVVSLAMPTVMGGDFNTTDCTSAKECKLPYPENFYTLLGKHIKNYGAFKESKAGLTPDRTFFGAYQKDKPVEFITHRAFGIESRLDHMFANFGVPVTDKNSKVCPFAACTVNYGLLGGNLLDKTDFDHRPVFARLGFKPIQTIVPLLQARTSAADQRPPEKIPPTAASVAPFPALLQRTEEKSTATK